MIDNTRIYRCECRVRSLQHRFTTDASGKWVLFVDPQKAHLLRDVSYTVDRIHSKSKLLRARATTSAPGIKVGQSLHQLVARIRRKRRRAWASNRNYLDCRPSNLQSLSFSDARILTTVRPSTRAVGVRKNARPKFMKTWFCPWSAHIGVDGKNLYLGAFPTLEEAQAAWDVAATMLHGPNATTNVSLGLLSRVVANTKLCRRAAKAARQVIEDHRSGELARKYRALMKAKSRPKAFQLFSDIRAIGKPTPAPRVEVARFATAGA
jgi:hypothetical protein